MLGGALLGVAAGLMALPEAKELQAAPRPSAGFVPEPGELWAATGRVDITPPPGTPLGGYGGGPRRRDPPYIPDLNPFNNYVWFNPYEGVHDRVYAKLLLLDNGRSRVLFVKMDTIGATEKFRKDIAAHALRHGIAAPNVIVSGTHTHGGSGALADQKLWYLVAMDAFDVGLYMETLQLITQGVDRLAGVLQPARLGMGRSEAYHLSRNRRNHPGRFDPELGVFLVERLDGSPLAVLFNFAVHGTALGDENMLVTRDLMGYAEDKLEAELGSGALALFVNGAEGDVAPNKGGLPDFEGARWTGEGLAEEVLAVLPSIAPERRIVLEARSSRIQLPPAYVECSEQWDSPNNICTQIPDSIPDEWLRISLDGLIDKQIQFHALRIQDTVIATVPGEPITNIGLAIKEGIRQRGHAQGLVFGCTNGHIAYITTEEEYYEGGYEAQATLYGPGTGALVVESSLHAVDLLQEPASSTARVRG
jgi:hypothetical protein